LHRHTKKVTVAIIGGLVVLVGLVLVPYPGPGWLIVFAGLAILSTEFVFAQKALDLAGLTLNKNTVPDEPMSPFYPSGIRLGTPASTTRGMREKEMEFIGKQILKVVELIRNYRLPEKKEERKKYISSFQEVMEKNKDIKKIKEEVKRFALRFPIP